MILFFMLNLARLVVSQPSPAPTPTTPMPSAMSTLAPTVAPSSTGAVANASELDGLFALYDGIGVYKNLEFV
jgi:hypothetical protein